MISNIEYNQDTTQTVALTRKSHKNQDSRKLLRVKDPHFHYIDFKIDLRIDVKIKVKEDVLRLVFD